MTQLIASMEVTKLAQKSKEEFFVNMSHEMKTPLNAVIGFSRVLQHRIKDDPKSLMLLETIEQAGNDLSGLVESIIDMRKIQDRSLELVKEFFDAKTVLQACCEQYNEKAKAKELKYEIDIEKSIISDELLYEENHIVSKNSKDKTLIKDFLNIYKKNEVRWKEGASPEFKNLRSYDLTRSLLEEVVSFLYYIFGDFYFFWYQDTYLDKHINGKIVDQGEYWITFFDQKYQKNDKAFQLFYILRSYQLVERFDKVETYFLKLKELFPDSIWTKEASYYLNEND